MPMIQQPDRTPVTGDRPSRAIAVAAGAALVAVALTAVLGLQKLLGDTVRDAALIEVPATAPDAALTYTDAPDGEVFFADRDSVTVRIPWDMTVGDFLSLYHLENNASARTALAEQLSARGDEARLKKGDEVGFRLTIGRGR
jgi:uncharacterized membrane protein